MSTSVRMEQLRSMSGLVFDQWRILSSRAELLRVAFTNKQVVLSFKGNRARGFDLTRTAIAESVAIGTVRLLKARDKREVCLEHLVIALKDPTDPLYKALKAYYSEPQITPYSERTMKRFSPELRATLQRENQIREEQIAGKQFDGIAKSIIRKASKLLSMSTTNNLLSIRDKVIAHAETKIESGKRRLSASGDFPVTYHDVFKAIKTLGWLSAKCELLFNGTGLLLDEEIQLGRKTAVEFWLK